MRANFGESETHFLCVMFASYEYFDFPYLLFIQNYVIPFVLLQYHNLKYKKVYFHSVQFSGLIE